MARRTWRESDHPRHPGGSDQGGRFRERVGSGGWAARLSSMLGGRRGSIEYTVGRAGGRSDLGDTSRDDLRRALAQSDADYARGAGHFDPADDPRALRSVQVGISNENGDGVASYEGARAAMSQALGREYRGNLERESDDGLWLVDLPGEDGDELIENGFWGRDNEDGYSIEAEWPDGEDPRGNLDEEDGVALFPEERTRLTNQGVADALAPRREAPEQIGSFESLPDTDEPGVKEATAQNLADYPGLLNGDYEVYDSLNGWGVVLDAYETDRYSYEDDEETVIEIEGEGIHFTAEAGEGVKIRRRRRA